MTASQDPDRVPSFFLLVPGPFRDAAAIVSALANQGLAAEASSDASIEHGGIRVDLIEDSAIADAFGYGRDGRLEDTLLERLHGVDRAALVEIGLRLDEDAARVAAIGRALRDAGGLAVRMEASGAASAWEPWFEGLESGDPWRVYESAVILVGDDDGTLFTCGMHHFDLPDAELATSDPAEAVEWLDTFSVYQLAERPALSSGHTFRPSAEDARRVIERWPDHRHDPADGRHNPFGRWRFLPEGVDGLEPLAPLPVPIPALVAVLMAAERSKGRPLSRPEVEALAEKCVSMTMDPGAALALERSRGYADIEPRLAWEQWQIVRSW